MIRTKIKHIAVIMTCFWIGWAVQSDSNELSMPQQYIEKGSGRNSLRPESETGRCRDCEEDEGWFPVRARVKEKYDCKDGLSKKWFKDREHGWFFGEICVNPEDGGEEVQSTVPEHESEKVKPEPKSADDEKTGPLYVSVVPGEASWKVSRESLELLKDPVYLNTLSAYSVRQAFVNVRDMAVMNPTRENIETWLAIKNFVSEKSNHFAYAVRAVTLNHPEYDVSRYEGEDEGAGDQMTAMQQDKRMQFISSRRDYVGLVFFYSPTCEVCKRQAKLLRFFANTTGLAVQGISSGECMPEWPDCIVSPELFMKYNVNRTPTLMMIYRKDLSDDAKNVSQIVSNGMISVQGLIDRLAIFMRYFESGKFQDSVDLGELHDSEDGSSESGRLPEVQWLNPETMDSGGEGFVGRSFR